MKFIEQINEDLENLCNVYAAGNAHGIPNSKGCYKITDIRYLPSIELNDQTPEFLRRLSEILDKYF